MSKNITGRVSKDSSVKVNPCPRCQELTEIYRAKYASDEAPIQEQCDNPECLKRITIGLGG